MKIAFTFPGQGSQSLGMLSDLAARYPVIEHTFDEASEVLGYDLWKLTQDGPETSLNQTERTQPAMLAADIGVLRVWQQNNGSGATMMAGHSLGEYAALVAAQSLRFSVAVALVRERGRLMQASVEEGSGAIAAILGLTDEQVQSICLEASAHQHVSAVNFNAPGQVAVAGHVAAVERASTLAKAAGAKRVLRLPLSVPVHCELMRPAAAAFSEPLSAADFKSPIVPVVNNVNVKPHDLTDIRQILMQQIHQPVRWTETVQRLAADGVDTLIELGPGKVLSGLARRIDRHLLALPVTDDASLNKALEQTRG